MAAIADCWQCDSPQPTLQAGPLVSHQTRPISPSSSTSPSLWATLGRCRPQLSIHSGVKKPIFSHLCGSTIGFLPTFPCLLIGHNIKYLFGLNFKHMVQFLHFKVLIWPMILSSTKNGHLAPFLGVYFDTWSHYNTKWTFPKSWAPQYHITTNSHICPTFGWQTGPLYHLKWSLGT